MPRNLVVALLGIALLGACAQPAAPEPVASLQEALTITVYRSPT